MEPRAATATDTTDPHSPPQASADEAAGTFSWRAHPARERPAHAILATGIVLVVAGFIYVTTASIGLSVLGTVILIGALNRFFLPSRFTIDSEGITAEYPLRRMRYRWRDLQRFLWDEYGGYLSTRAQRSRLDAYRGMHLLFNASDRQRIIDRIRESMGTPHSTLDSETGTPSE